MGERERAYVEQVCTHYLHTQTHSGLHKLKHALIFTLSLLHSRPHTYTHSFSHTHTGVKKQLANIDVFGKRR